MIFLEHTCHVYFRPVRHSEYDLAVFEGYFLGAGQHFRELVRLFFSGVVGFGHPLQIAKNAHRGKGEAKPRKTKTVSEPIKHARQEEK